jgi:4-amino-4-deoxy-L-arabinose transferase-like glycosyltransferase
LRHKILLLLALFAVKLTVALQFDRHPLLQPNTGLDTSAYVELAHRVSGGDVALGPGLYYVAPLYIYFLALAHTATAARVLQALLGTVAVALIFLTAKEWFGKRAAWISAVLAALTGVFTYYEALILQSSLDVFLTALGLWLVTKQRWLLAGCAFGIASLNRPNMLLAAVLIWSAAAVPPLFARRPGRRAPHWFLAGLLLGLAPVTVRNLAVAHQWSLVSSHGGINFYIGNGEGATGFFHAVPGMPSTIEGLARDAHRVAEAATRRTLTDAEVSAYYSGLAWQWIRAHPAAWLRLLAWKTYAFLNTAHVSTPFSYTFYAYDAGTLLRVLFVGPWLLVPLGIVGLARRRQLPLIVFAAAYAASVILFFITERYKLPFFVAMAIAAGAGAEALRTWRRAAVAIALAIAVNWPLHLDDGRTEERLRMAEYEASRGSVAEAERWAGGVQSPRVEYLLGRAYLAAGRPSEALPHLRSATAQRVNVPLAGYDLVVALQQTGDRDGAVRVLRALKPPPNSNVVVFLQLARKAAELDAPEVAEPFLRRAVKVAPDNRAAQQMLAITLRALGR